MLKSIAATFCLLSFFAGCAAPTHSSAPQASAGPAAAVSSVDSAAAADSREYETVWVPPQTGSLLGGGVVRVPKTSSSGVDENALLANIRHLNAAAGSPNERPFVVQAVSRVTGVSARELQAQQDLLRLRFGELCAANAIAHGNSGKVQEIATLRGRGQTWTQLAKANGLSIATVARAAHDANELTVSSYTNYSERQKGAEHRLKESGVQIFPRPEGE